MVAPPLTPNNFLNQKKNHFDLCCCHYGDVIYIKFSEKTLITTIFNQIKEFTICPFFLSLFKKFAKMGKCLTFLKICISHFFAIQTKVTKSKQYRIKFLHIEYLHDCENYRRSARVKLIGHIQH